MTKPTQASQPTRRVRVGWLVLAIALLAVGLTTLFLGLRVTPPEAAPLAKEPFSVSVPGASPGTGSRTGQGDTTSGSATSGSATGSTTAETLPSPAQMRPNRLYIPALGVDAAVVQEDATQGRMDVPDARAVGMFSAGPSLGARVGTTILAGHVSYNQVRGALHDLADVQPYTTVIVTDGSGTPTYWSIISLKNYPKVSLDATSAASMFPATGERRLALITCGGEVHFDGSHYTYNDNVVALAAPIPPPAR